MKEFVHRTLWQPCRTAFTSGTEPVLIEGGHTAQLSDALASRDVAAFCQVVKERSLRLGDRFRAISRPVIRPSRAIRPRSLTVLKFIIRMNTPRDKRQRSGMVLAIPDRSLERQAREVHLGFPNQLPSSEALECRDNAR